MRSIGSLFLAALLAAGCSTYREELNRGQRLYDENEYERALAIWRDVELDMDSLSDNDQARYAYLRGMTDYRLGFRPDARHWLAIAKAIDMAHPGGLSGDWKGRVEEALNDLNREVYGGAEAISESTAVEHTKPAEGTAPPQQEAPPQSGTPPASGGAQFGGSGSVQFGTK
jgi:hypothetical protein